MIETCNLQVFVKFGPFLKKQKIVNFYYHSHLGLSNFNAVNSVQCALCIEKCVDFPVHNFFQSVKKNVNCKFVICNVHNAQNAGPRQQLIANKQYLENQDCCCCCLLASCNLLAAAALSRLSSAPLPISQWILENGMEQPCSVGEMHAAQSAQCSCRCSL